MLFSLEFQVKDLSTVNGTYVNESRIPDQSYVTLCHSDLIRFGADDTTFRVEKFPSGNNSPRSVIGSVDGGSPRVGGSSVDGSANGVSASTSTASSKAITVAVKNAADFTSAAIIQPAYHPENHNSKASIIRSNVSPNRLHTTQKSSPFSQRRESHPTYHSDDNANHHQLNPAFRHPQSPKPRPSQQPDDLTNQNLQKDNRVRISVVSQDVDHKAHRDVDPKSHPDKVSFEPQKDYKEASRSLTSITTSTSITSSAFSTVSPSPIKTSPAIHSLSQSSPTVTKSSMSIYSPSTSIYSPSTSIYSPSTPISNPPSPAVGRGLPSWAQRGIARDMAQCDICADAEDDSKAGHTCGKTSPVKETSTAPANRIKTPLYGQPNWWGEMDLVSNDNDASRDYNHNPGEKVAG